MARKLFGTDGVRGVAGELLTAELALALGRAATFESAAERPQVLIVRDTRESGPDAGGGARRRASPARGATRWSPGCCRRPAASILVRRLGLDLAVVISASHNPWRDNGIKFFGADGRKLGDEAEARIERLGQRLAAGRRPDQHDDRPRPRARGRHSTTTCASSSAPFRSTSPGCGSCSTAPTAPPTAPRRQIFERLGAEVEVLDAEPDGRNINEGCGSTHPGGARRARGRRAAPRSASPSTATATGWSRSTRPARSATATS